jgi:hypothetical protein
MPGVLPKAAAPAQTAARKYGYRGMMRGDGPGAKNGIQKNRLQRAAPVEKSLFQGPYHEIAGASYFRHKSKKNVVMAKI